MRASKKSSLWSVYYFLLRVISPFALLGLRVHSIVFRQPRTRVVVINERKEVLLILSALGTPGVWSLPGGGVNRGESLKSAVQRELCEEIGVSLKDDRFIYFTTIEKGEVKNHSYQAPIFSVLVDHEEISLQSIQKTEIIEASWFPLDRLPDHMSLLALESINRLPDNLEIDRIDRDYLER